MIVRPFVVAVPLVFALAAAHPGAAAAQPGLTPVPPAPGIAVAGVFDPRVTYRVPLGDSPSRGPADALVTVVEFSDFGCPYCGRAQDTLAALERLYPGQLRVVYRQNPLDLEDGTLAAEVALAAAAQGAFWPMHDRLFAVRGRVSRARAETFALDLGLDLARFRRDLESGKPRQRVFADAAAAHALGVASTPFFFINGRPVKGARPLAVFAEIVAQELARARDLAARGTSPADVYRVVTARGRTRGDADPAREDDYPAADLDPLALYPIGPGLPGHARGPDDALVTIAVFSDFECPYCRQIEPALAKLRAAYPDDVRIEYRHLPLTFHPHAQLAAEAAVAAGAQGEFWRYHDLLYENQRALTRADLERYAAELGLDMAAFRAALADRRYRDAVAADAAVAGSFGVRGTPTLFVNGSPIQGVVAYEYLADVYVARKLAQARELLRRGVARRDVYSIVTNPNTDSDNVSGGHAFGRDGAIIVDPALDRGSGEVQAACRDRDSRRAAHLYEQLKGADRSQVRIDCRTYGVDLPE